MNQDTICAIATAQGGAIGSIRVSGPEAISITSRIFKPAKAGKLFNDQKPYTLTFGRIYDGEEIIDEVEHIDDDGNITTPFSTKDIKVTKGVNITLFWFLKWH